MGFSDDTPQELPGMEVDVITEDETDLKDLMKTLTRDAEEERIFVKREILSGVQALGG